MRLRGVCYDVGRCLFGDWRKFTFVFPNNPYHDDPRHDLDLASYSLVKSFDRGHRGTTYPDMTLEPKRSFDAVARYYAGASDGDGSPAGQR